MNSELIMKSDVLDILFENRNKAYGAYMLRKFYNKRLIKSLAVTFGSVVLFSAFTLLPESAEPVNYFASDPGFTKLTELVKKVEVKPKIKEGIKAKPLSTVKFLTKIKLVDKIDSVDILLDPAQREVGNNSNIIINSGLIHLGIHLRETDEETGGITTSAATPVAITQPLEVAEIMPQYPGGMEALRKFLIRHLSNPRELEAGELVSVKVKFVVGYDGKLQHFQLVQDGGTEFNEEVIRVLKKMPAWIPGRSNGQSVPVYYTIPVRFIAEN